jgi:hypothetical protein
MDLKYKNTLFYLTVTWFHGINLLIITGKLLEGREPDSFRNGKWFME